MVLEPLSSSENPKTQRSLPLPNLQILEGSNQEHLLANSNSSRDYKTLEKYRRHPLGFQATKQPFHWRVVVAVSPSAHALSHPIAPQSLSETAAAVLASLIAVKQDASWSATHFIRPVERLDDQIGIRPGGHDPTHHPAAVKIQYNGQVMPSPLCPDVGDVAAQGPVRRCHGELPFEEFGNVRTFNRGFLVSVRTGLLADQSLFLHQASELEASHLDALVAKHGNDTAAAGRTTALAEQFVDAAAQAHPANIDTTPPGQMGVITGSGQLEH